MTPDDPRHATNAGYQAGCRDQCCRTGHATAMAARRKRAYLSRSSDTRSALGSQRRIQGLMAMGWRQSDIAEAGGWTDKSLIRDILKRDRVHVLTARRVDAVYRELCMKRGPSDNAREYAARKGWLPPLAWDEIDDPSPRLVLAAKMNTPRIGELSVADRRGVVVQLRAEGVSTTEIALRCGVSPDVISKDLRRTA